MSLLTPTGSLTNNIYANAQQETPVVGMGATELWHTDRHAVTIVSVSKNGKRIEVQRDNAKRLDKNGLSESQTYEYTPNPDAPRLTYTLRRNGRWVAVGSGRVTGRALLIGHRDEYIDPCF